jgi:hypothetical protein
MPLIHREATEADIQRRFASQQEKWMPQAQRQLLAAWDTGGLFGVALEDEHGLQGLALAGFLDREFERTILTMPQPYVGSLALEWIAAGRSPLLPGLDADPEPAARIATELGLHLHFFEFHWEGPKAGPEAFAPRALLSQAVQDRFLGCRLRNMTVEAHGEAIEQLRIGGWSVFNPYPTMPADDFVALCGVNRELADRSSNPWLFQAFAPALPVVPLSHRQRRILFHFRNGLPDEEIAERVFLSPKSMKTNWDRIFEAFETLPGFPFGRSKRRAVQEYLRSHPEEAWPAAR